MFQRIGLAILASTVLMSPVTTLGQTQGTPQPQRGQKAAAKKPPTPLTLRQVIESLSSLRNSKRVEDQITRAGVQFRATPETVDILKQFGASPKLISMIPVPVAPPQPTPPAPKIAGALTVVCEPNDCLVVVNDKYEGSTEQNRKTVSGLRPGDATIQVFADGYDHVTRQVQLQEGTPIEEKFSLKRSMLVRQQSASASLLKLVSNLGGADGLAELGDIEGSATMRWTNSAGVVEQWAMTFNKRIGRNLSTTFKTRDGQCTGTILGQSSKVECRGELKNSGEKIAEQGTSLFLSYQLQDTLQALLKRPLITSEADENRVESIDSQDSYVLTIGKDGLITDLVYRIGNTDAPIHVQYSNYLNLNSGRYPGRISMGRLNSEPAWVFTLNSVRTRLGRGQ